MTEVAERLINQARSRGVSLEVNGEKVKLRADAPLSPEIMEQLRQHKAEVRRHLIIERAFALAEQTNDALGIISPLVREINRLSWAVLDLQDAGIPEGIWLPLQQRCRELESEYSRAKG